MMPDLSILALPALPILMLCQWWVLRRIWRARVHAAQARHARYKARAEMLIEITKQQLASLQQQLTGGPPMRRPSSAYPAALMRARAQRSAPRDAELIVVDEDGASTHLPDSPLAFADTVPAEG